MSIQRPRTPECPRPVLLGHQPCQSSGRWTNLTTRSLDLIAAQSSAVGGSAAPTSDVIKTTTPLNHRKSNHFTSCVTKGMVLLRMLI
ncbi:hypothetical protein ElyMa_003894000 [Elysia marginata]|uniref:Uncharacterized protein n=1 Tax=Elysia marginata TaxID=1093978 RepID=A0AAV4FML4_9GAST|nr:hypothetical protein ElyMa_003894000 [Elysia marginata]